MSYCRWSPVCDVYVYEDVSGGWTTHVAGVQRQVHLKGEPYPELDWSTPDALHRTFNAQREWRGETRYQDTGLPRVEDRYNHNTPGECADNLQDLKDKGFLVPQHAIDALREEQDEMSGV